MSLLYRSIFTIDHEDAVGRARAAFEGWMSTKDASFRVPESGDAVSGGLTVGVLAGQKGPRQALRITTSETNGHGRWSTTLTTASDGLAGWVWVDIDLQSNRLSARPPAVDVPSFVSQLLAGGTCQAGSTILASTPAIIGHDEATRFIAHLMDGERSIPVVAVTHDRYNSAQEANRRAAKVLQRLDGRADPLDVQRDVGGDRQGGG